MTKLRTISGIEIQGDIETRSGFQEWINEVFRDTGVELVKLLTKEKLSKDELLEKLLSYRGLIQESYQYLMGLKKGNKGTLASIHGLKINEK